VTNKLSNMIKPHMYGFPRGYPFI